WLFFFSSRRRHTRFKCDWSSDVCSSDLRDRFLLLVGLLLGAAPLAAQQRMVIRPEPGTPVVAVEVLIAAGPADEPEGKAGLANRSEERRVGKEGRPARTAQQ